ncbi:hypothetical protein SBA6_530005 [Candidatus Sulfopaludibacter sp. SbA6]|nr:hypothetical protein SBA6_530005 [Candidatus Sulfopaludibacter sp. SbA6]
MYAIDFEGLGIRTLPLLDTDDVSWAIPNLNDLVYIRLCTTERTANLRLGRCRNRYNEDSGRERQFLEHSLALSVTNSHPEQSGRTT